MTISSSDSTGTWPMMICPPTSSSLAQSRRLGKAMLGVTAKKARLSRRRDTDDDMFLRWQSDDGFCVLWIRLLLA
eukprot:scaffold2581_cov164-Pinguiococcus_pyrenoidosus.AAC.2